MKTEQKVPWEVKWADAMKKVKDLFNQTELQSNIVKEQVEVKHQS